MNKELISSDGFTPRPMTQASTAYATGLVPSSHEFSSSKFQEQHSGQSTPILPKLNKISSEREIK